MCESCSDVETCSNICKSKLKPVSSYVRGTDAHGTYNFGFKGEAPLERNGGFRGCVTEVLGGCAGFDEAEGAETAERAEEAERAEGAEEAEELSNSPSVYGWSSSVAVY